MRNKLIIGLLVLTLLGLGAISYFHFEPVVQAEEEVENKDQSSDQEAKENGEKEEEKKYGMKQNYYAPRFELEDMNGEIKGLEDYEGKFVLLNFWATWCKYCEEEMPDLQKFHEENKEDIIVVGVDVGEGKKTVQKFLDKYDITYPNLLDTDKKVSQKYLVRAYPTTYILSREGKLLYMVKGLVTAETLEKIKETLYDKHDK